MEFSVKAVKAKNEKILLQSHSNFRSRAKFGSQGGELWRQGLPA